MMRRRVIAAFLLAVLSLIGSPADAHITRIASRIRHRSTAIEGDTVTKLGGVVTSKRARCLSEREVSIYAGDRRFGSGETDANGAWEVEGNKPAGRTYRFTVHPKRLPAAAQGHSHVCDAHTLFKTIEDV